ncbi:MAG: GNAT family N-acetyltransferase [Actinomycetaceae bacterium]|nr:GNAT family N-acetyltransferase [Actinomycetaceae bacterium]
MVVSVRPANAADIAVISGIQARNMRQELAMTLPNAAPVFLQRIVPAAFVPGWEIALADTDGRKHVLVATDDAEIVGFCAVAPAEEVGAKAMGAPLPIMERPADAQIFSLEVDPGRLGNGHGSRLLMAATDILGRTGVGRVQLWLNPADSAKVRFYQEAGFAPAGVRRGLDVGGQTLTQHLWYTDLRGSDQDQGEDTGQGEIVASKGSDYRQQPSPHFGTCAENAKNVGDANDPGSSERAEKVENGTQVPLSRINQNS